MLIYEVSSFRGVAESLLYGSVSGGINMYLKQYQPSGETSKQEQVFLLVLIVLPTLTAVFF
jgi:hypothetical protein